MIPPHLFLIFSFTFEVIGVKFLIGSHRHGNDFRDCAGFCSCQTDSLKCQRPNTLDAIPLLSSEEERALVTKIFFEHQPRFKILSEDQLRFYLNIEMLTIQNTGLHIIAPSAFASTRKLQEINLRSNRISVLHWKLFQGMKLMRLLIDDNPIICNCSAKWIQEISNSEEHILSPFWDQVTCINPENPISPAMIKNITIPNCELPKVNVTPEKMILNESQSAVIICSASGDPPLSLYWNTTSLVSNHTVGDLVMLGMVDYATGVATNFSFDSNDTIQALSLYASRREDNGFISCIAENDVGQEIAQVAFEIYAVPNIINMKVAQRFYWCIDYQVTGFPKPHRTWYFNNQLLQNPMIRDLENPWTIKNPYLAHGCLQFEWVSQVNEGIYTLVASSALGEVNHTIDVEFYKEPPFLVHPSRIPQGRFPLSILKIPEKPEAEDKSYTSFLLLALSTAAVVLILVITIVCLVQRIKHCASPDGPADESSTRFFLCPQQRKNRPRTQTMPLNLFHNMIINTNYSRDRDQANTIEIPHIAREKVNLGRILGEGAFGNVYFGIVDHLTPGESKTQVAVKILKDNKNKDAKLEFLNETAILASLQHKNIIRLYGVSMDGENQLMIFEYMKYGSLETFLRDRAPEVQKCPELKIPDLMHICCQIASGMDYLASLNIVHMDLATRNCLVGNQLLVKIADFGMAVNLSKNNCFLVGRYSLFPNSWMPPESKFLRKVSRNSDIWSFGLILWEIFSFGKLPWNELPNSAVIQAIQKNKVLPRPSNCPAALYELMKACWKIAPEERIPIKRICAQLELLRSQTLSAY